MCASVLECPDPLTVRVDGQVIDYSVQVGTIGIGSMVFRVRIVGTKYPEFLLGRYAAVKYVASRKRRPGELEYLR